MQDSLYKKISNDAFLKEYKINELILSVLELKDWSDKCPSEKDKSSSMFDFKVINFQNKSFDRPSMWLEPNSDDINSIIEYETLKEWSKNSIYLCKPENEDEHYINNSATVNNLILDPFFYTEEEICKITKTRYEKGINPIRPLIRKHLKSSKAVIEGIKLDFKVPPLYFQNHNKTGHFKLVTVFNGLENSDKSKNEIVEEYKNRFKYFLSHSKDAYIARIKSYQNNTNLFPPLPEPKECIYSFEMIDEPPEKKFIKVKHVNGGSGRLRMLKIKKVFEYLYARNNQIGIKPPEVINHCKITGKVPEKALKTYIEEINSMLRDVHCKMGRHQYIKWDSNGINPEIP